MRCYFISKSSGVYRIESSSVHCPCWGNPALANSDLAPSYASHSGDCCCFTDLDDGNMGTTRKLDANQYAALLNAAARGQHKFALGRLTGSFVRKSRLPPELYLPFVATVPKQTLAKPSSNDDSLSDKIFARISLRRISGPVIRYAFEAKLFGQLPVIFTQAALVKGLLKLSCFRGSSRSSRNYCRVAMMLF